MTRTANLPTDGAAAIQLTRSRRGSPCIQRLAVWALGRALTRCDSESTPSNGWRSGPPSGVQVALRGRNLRMPEHHREPDDVAALAEVVRREGVAEPVPAEDRPSTFFLAGGANALDRTI